LLLDVVAGEVQGEARRGAVVLAIRGLDKVANRVLVGIVESLSAVNNENLHAPKVSVCARFFLF